MELHPGVLGLIFAEGDMAVDQAIARLSIELGERTPVRLPDVKSVHCCYRGDYRVAYYFDPAKGQMMYSVAIGYEASAAPRRTLPRYRCHKEVRALKIKQLKYDDSSGNYWFLPAEQGFALVELDIEFMRRHTPEAGGYYVIYADGSWSYSPAKAFEEGYTRIE